MTGRAGTPPLALALGLALATVGAAGGCADPGGDDRILVAAASSLGEAAEAVAADLEATHPGAAVDVTTGSTAALAAQLEAGAPFDVLVAADAATTAALAGAGATTGSPPVVVATNELVVVVPAGNPDRVAGLEDLVGLDVVALCATDAPCGRYAAEALAAAGVVVDEGRVTRGTNARATLAAVADGGADAGIVYATDAAAAADRVDAVALPADVAPEVVATAVALDGPGDDALADAFLGALVGDPGRRALGQAGFVLP